MKKIVFLLLVSLIMTKAFSQVFTVPVSGTQTKYACAGKISDGEGYYSNYEDGTLTIYPDKDGNYTRLTFTKWSMDSYYDYLYIYDGTSTSANLIGSYSPYSPNSVTASNASGALTLRFVTNGYYTYEGFEATIQCVTNPSLPDLRISVGDLNSTYYTGTSINTYFQIYNDGTTSSPSGKAGYYLSKDNNLDTTDTFIKSDNFYSIYPNSYTSVSASITISKETKPGSYYILFKADYLNVINEQDKLNNIAAKAIDIQKPTIDLQPKSLLLNSTNVPSGSNASITATLFNKSNIEISNIQSAVFLSKDTRVDATDLRLHSFQTSYVSASSSTNLYETVNIPTDAAPGLYYLILQTDPDNLIEESLENNNTTNTAISIVEPENDLYPVFSNIPVRFVKETNTSVTLNIYNDGNISNQNCHLALYLSKDSIYDTKDQYLNLTNISSINPNSYEYIYTNITIPKSVAAGKYYILAISDFLNIVTETNEENNIAVKAVSVEDAILDISLTSLSTTAENFIAGSSLNFYFTLSNIGNKSAYINLGYYISSDSIFNTNAKLLNTYSYYSLDGGQSTSGSGYMYLPSDANGDYYIYAVADYTNTINEKNELNNVAKKKITVSPAFVDLIINSPSVSPSSAIPGGSLYLSSYIYNTGNSYSDFSYSGYYLSTDSIWDKDDIYLNNNYNSSISNSGYTYSNLYANIPLTSKTGNYYILFVADYTSLIKESNEKNNVKAVKIKVVDPVVDLRVSSNPSDTYTAGIGESLYMETTVSNWGTTATPSGNVGIYFSTDTVYDAKDEFLTFRAFETINASQNTGISTYLTVPDKAPGNYYILFYADYQNKITETNENNNIGYRKLNISYSGTDLTLNNVNVNPTKDIGAGATIFASAMLSNNGSYYINYASLGYYFSKDTILDSSDELLDYSINNSLYKGNYSYAYKYITIPSKTKKGKYYILFKADYDNYLSEINEENNLKNIPVFVSEPTLDLQVTYLYNNNVYETMSYVNVAAGITNNGNIQSPGSNTTLYISKDTILSAGDLALETKPTGSITSNSSTDIYLGGYLPDSIPAGIYYLIVKTDVDGVIAETNENNNLKIAKIRISSEFLNLSFYKEPENYFYGSRGGILPINYSIKLTGTFTSKNFNVKYYIRNIDSTVSNTRIYLGKYIHGISGEIANISDTLSIPDDIDDGGYYLYTILDEDNDLLENIEYDNQANSKLYLNVITNVTKTLGQKLISLAPNPAISDFYVNGLEGTNLAEITILTDLGEVLETITVSSKEEKIDITNLKEGLYTIRIKYDDKIETEKLVITK